MYFFTALKVDNIFMYDRIPVVKLLFNLASNFFGSEIGLGILDLVMDVRRTKFLPEAPAAPLPASPAVVRSQT